MTPLLTALRAACLVEVPSVRGLAELAHGRAQRRLRGFVPLVRLLVLLVALDLRLYVGHAWESFRVVCGCRDVEAYPSRTPLLKPAALKPRVRQGHYAGHGIMEHPGR